MSLYPYPLTLTIDMVGFSFSFLRSLVINTSIERPLEAGIDTGKFSIFCAPQFTKNRKQPPRLWH
jgi:hypothetical protein